MIDADAMIFNMMYDNPLTQTILDFTDALYHDGNIDAISKEEMRDLLSKGQQLSKGWLLGELQRHIYALNLPVLEGQNFQAITCGGWVGFLAQLINNTFVHGQADTLDLSEASTRIARSVLSFANVRGKACQAIQGDMYAFDYAPYDIIINTAAEHIPDVQAWSDSIPKGKALVIQSNNARHIPDHISCVDSADELASKLNLSEVLFADQLEFGMYTRFMVIGKK